ncbi:hypothetical protein E3N88_30149 [Mikania micrantha]|uniref:Uncharacterized protein n=1 Tax=Mikania micrantha TaxID=192012 RepID=A0A5N6MLG8_9ASTR|nr:hypothetical protein E3N88_30149 [Mikania micrantha]
MHNRGAKLTALVMKMQHVSDSTRQIKAPPTGKGNVSKRSGNEDKWASESSAVDQAKKTKKRTLGDRIPAVLGVFFCDFGTLIKLRSCWSLTMESRACLGLVEVKKKLSFEYFLYLFMF